MIKKVYFWKNYLSLNLSIGMFFLISLTLLYLESQNEVSLVNALNKVSLSPDGSDFNLRAPIDLNESGALNNYTFDYTDALPTLFNNIKQSVVQITLPQTSHINEPLPSRLGSGFFYDKDGHIVTNFHVVDGSIDNKAFVTFLDGVSYEAEIVGSDPYADLAVIKLIDINENITSKLKPLKLSNSSDTEIGERVVAIGNPFGLSGSLTEGIVSGLGRLMPTGDSDEPSDMPFKENRVPTTTPSFSIPDIIQTDAAINPGNSGGPLINMKGEVIGINTAIFSNTGGYSGIGFALPSNFLMKIVPSLIENGTYFHPYIGINGFDITPEIAKILNLTESLGFLVVNVTKGSPAELAGVQEGNYTTIINGLPVELGGDVIIKVDDRDVRKVDDILSYLENNKDIGETVSLTVLRGPNLEKKVIDVMLVPRPEMKLKFDTPSLGVVGIDMTSEIANLMNLTRDDGFLITSIINNSSASKAKLQGGYLMTDINGLPVELGGDVIIKIDDRNIRNQQDVVEYIQSKKIGDSVVITVIREGKVMIKTLNLDDSSANKLNLNNKPDKLVENPFQSSIPKKNLDDLLGYCYKILSKGDCDTLFSTK